MWIYACRRLLLLPVTLFFIVLFNFVIINLAPGDPSSYSGISPQGTASRREDRSIAFPSDERYLHFREFYGLTLPILFNTWPWLTRESTEKTLTILSTQKDFLPTKQYSEIKVKFGDQSRFLMPQLLSILEDPRTSDLMRRMAAQFFIRGGTRSAFIGPKLTPMQKEWNRKIGQDDQFLRSSLWSPLATAEEIKVHVNSMRNWYNDNQVFYDFQPTWTTKIKQFFFETRFVKYMGRVVRLDFGTLRNDSNRTVISEVTKRFKYSLTLALIPMGITLVLCQCFGFLMACNQGKWPDHSLNLFFLTLYAIPVFVVAPFLIENVALYHCFPFSHDPIPLSGFSSPDRIYENETSIQRLIDIFKHIALPLVAILYNSLASESRLSRTAILEVLRQDYVRTARAKGVSPFGVMIKHVGRNAAITIVTSVAGSLGIILGGSLIVETLFDINGFGKFFYDAILNRDYNVIMFSALAGSFLTLLGYLTADLAYMWLDPRIRLD